MLDRTEIFKRIKGIGRKFEYKYEFLIEKKYEKKLLSKYAQNALKPE